MPIIKAGGKLIYYAHVPKCGGSSVSRYLKDRFGAVAFSNTTFTQTPPDQRWSKTSPQHVDANSLGAMFPAGFFDATFTIVRHPVSRVVSAFHFQKEVERTVPVETTFGEWLLDLEDRLAGDRFVYDNHVRPMSEIVPEAAHVIYMEHGLDALVPWFDAVVGNDGGPRQLAEVNRRGAYTRSPGEKVVPSAMDLDIISRIYGGDFRRFGYRIDSRKPLSAPPEGDTNPNRTRMPLRGSRRGGISLSAALDRLRRLG